MPTHLYVPSSYASSLVDLFDEVDLYIVLLFLQILDLEAAIDHIQKDE